MKKWTFTLETADDESVDPQYTLDQNPRFGIQDARAYGGGLVVVEHSAHDDADFWIKHHGVHREIEPAKAECIQRASATTPEE